MTCALITIEKTSPRDAWPQALHGLIYDMNIPEEVTRLNESAWLVPLDSCLLFLARLICICHDEGLRQSVAFFEQKPSFFSAPNNPA
jgi:hypothetical protein